MNLQHCGICLCNDWKELFHGIVHRRIRAGLMPVTEEPFKPAAPQLTQEQQAYKDELLGKIKELRSKFGMVRKEVNAAMERGDAQTVNLLRPQEHLLEDQLLEAMKTAKAAGETGSIVLSLSLSHHPRQK